MGYGKKTFADNKITATVAADLLKLSGELPEAIKCNSMGKPALIRQHISGAQLIKQGQKLPDGSRINANRIYIQDVPVKIDHFDQLKWHYSKNGMEGVDSYVKLVHHYEKLRLDRILRSKAWYIRLWVLIKETFVKPKDPITLVK